ncbi:hypothetical protein [Chryseobacterium sp. W4I1]|uniref:hypothetical protein n=1 Tax=Chryseobacterium sp. W4I1 TaxID=3042293 RepID=UPI0027870A13|nr:hypothetical protein [Chryseobacterium sp. W4I1]MDQ0784485.1 hypothetical protein [Chryseobacterium sp. W4I1]
MKKENKSEKKLSLKKLQMTKVTNPGKIYGGLTLQGFEGVECTSPENASKPQGGGQLPTQ